MFGKSNKYKWFKIRENSGFVASELVVWSGEHDRFNCNFEFWQIAYYLSEIDLTKLMQNEMSESKDESNIGAIFHMNNMVVVWRQAIFDRWNEHTLSFQRLVQRSFLWSAVCHSMARANLNKFGEFIIMKYYHSLKEVQNLHQLKSTFHIPS